jgi:Tol biopolymer transport system component
VPNALGADWSPDGSKIVYQAVRNNERGLYISNADGSNEQLLRAGGISEAPTWSPDGSKIAFEFGADIYTINTDGTNETNITNTSTGWSGMSFILTGA